MSRTPDKSLLRNIPPVDDILDASALAIERARHPSFPWTRLVREVIDDLRQGRLGELPDEREGMREVIVSAVQNRLTRLRTGGMRRIINGTGVILHTNLGRAVLGPVIHDAIKDAVHHYLSLEIDLDTGKRGHRAEVLADLVAYVTGAEAATVVNNNAAAVYLVINSYSPPGRVLISRGELVEIGGSFRLPDILQRASLEMVEVGTTNRTYIDDFAKVARPGDILMRAHRSNYDIRGFTHDTNLDDLVALAAERECHVVYDLGSGSFYDFAAAGIAGEEHVRDVLARGVDCVTMSGDKLLGGVQAGFIVGSRKFLDRLRENPLRRAVRIDKITIAALQSLMRTYLFSDDAAARVPMLRQATDAKDVLRERAARVLGDLQQAVDPHYGLCVEDDEAAIGGGSFSGRKLDSVALVVRCRDEREAVTLAGNLRRADVPILTRIKGSEVRINLRTVLPEEDVELGRLMAASLAVAPRE
jgi:L-seryl-tRNA(Ser) seleniumtransferase